MHEAAFKNPANVDRWTARDSATQALTQLRTTNYWPLVGYGVGGLVLTLALLVNDLTDYEFSSLYEAVGVLAVSTAVYGLILYAVVMFATSLFGGFTHIIQRAWPRKSKGTLPASEDVSV